MRKVLLTVMMVSSLLAFNACKKDGPQGPAGPAGPTGATGATGAAGAVGATGATGAAGTKILPTTGAPAATVGATGDYAFDSATRILYGPKTATAWPAGIALSGTNGANGATGATGATGAAGANGATGATGATGAAGAAGMNGTQFLAGNGAPTNAIGVTGDFYFDKTTSIFYGPKLADGTWGTNALPLGQAYAAKTYTITRGFENVTEVTSGTPAVSVRQIGQDLVNTYSNYNIFTSYTVTANDLIRINQYPARPDGSGGWAEDREMIFQNDPVNAPGIFNRIPQTDADLGTGIFVVGAKFRYTRNSVNPTAEFTLTQADIDRLKDDNGNAFGYLTYAKALNSSVALGQTLVLASTKNVQLRNNTANFATQYTAATNFDLKTLVPNFEKYRQDGKVFVKYKYYTAKNASGAQSLVIHPGNDAGWVSIDAFANAFVTGTGGYDNNTNPFTVGFMGSGVAFGTVGTPVTVGTNQVATVVAGSGATATTIQNGLLRLNWSITSGNFNAATVTTNIGPTTLRNYSATLYDPVTVAFNNPSNTTAEFVARTFQTTYYSAPANLTATNNAGSSVSINNADQTVQRTVRTGGQEASYFTGTNLIRLSVFVVPGDVVSSLRAKGVNVDNANEIQKYVKL